MLTFFSQEYVLFVHNFIKLTYFTVLFLGFAWSFTVANSNAVDCLHINHWQGKVSPDRRADLLTHMTIDFCMLTFCKLYTT